jgi:chaperonin GroES
VRGGNFSFRLGEWKRVDSPGRALKDAILPYQAQGPSPVLFNLLEMLISAAKEITSVQDVLTGDAPAGNTPATTTLAMIEQGQKVMTAIFKRIHRAFGNELRILRRLNRDYLDEEEYFQLNEPEPQPKKGSDGQPIIGEDGQPVMEMVDAVQIGRQDYADDDLDVIPVSDPNQVSDMQKITRATAQMQMFNGDPLINQKKLREDMLVAMGARDIPVYFEVPPPSPDPKLMVEMGKLDIAKTDAESRRTTAQAGASKSFIDAAKGAAEIGLLPDAAWLAAHAVEESNEEDMNEPDNAGGVPGMGGEPADAGVPGAAPQPPVGADGGMGLGGARFPGEPGAGGGAGGIVPPEVPGGAPV